MAKALFLDRDGTLNEDYDFVHKPEQWTWCKGAVETIQWANTNEWKVIVVTNQSGVSRGLFSLEQVQKLHAWVDENLKKQQVFVDEWCIAHWHPNFHEGQDVNLLEYRKPGLRFYKEMIEKYHLDASQCVVMGDKPSDLKPGVKLGMKGFYIQSRFHEKNDQNWLAEHGFSPYQNIGEVLDKLKTLS
jgi:D-glycero-D-manno-heptose 1,7-bisphosphate phosphatase